jgi:hypothetical protein
MALGKSDTYKRRDEVMAFFGWRARKAKATEGADEPAEKAVAAN